MLDNEVFQTIKSAASLKSSLKQCYKILDYHTLLCWNVVARAISWVYFLPIFVFTVKIIWKYILPNSEDGNLNKFKGI